MRKKTRILILGGGFGGLAVYRHLHKQWHPCAESCVEINLINRENYSNFTPLLHEAATGSVSTEHVMQPIREIVNCAQNHFFAENIQRIDLKNRVVRTDVSEHSYDFLIVALGVRPNLPEEFMSNERVYTLKTVADAMRIKSGLFTALESMSSGKKKTEKNIVVAGGGATGVELAGQVMDLFDSDVRKIYPHIDVSKLGVHLVHGGDVVLNQMSQRAGELARKRLEELGVRVWLNDKVVGMKNDKTVLESGEGIGNSILLYAGGSESVMTGIVDQEYLDERGFLTVNKYGLVTNSENVFGLGDGAMCVDENFVLPATAQAAVWQAKEIAYNLRALIDNTNMRARIFRSRGDIIPIGDWWAVFGRGRLIMTGRLAWWIRRTVFLLTMHSWGKRLRTVVDWTVQIWQPRDSSVLAFKRRK